MASLASANQQGLILIGDASVIMGCQNPRYLTGVLWRVHRSTIRLVSQHWQISDGKKKGVQSQPFPQMGQEQSSQMYQNNIF